MKNIIFGDSHVWSMIDGYKKLFPDKLNSLHNNFFESEDFIFMPRHGLNWFDPDFVCADDVFRIHKDIVKNETPVDLIIPLNENSFNSCYYFSSIFFSSVLFAHKLWKEYRLPKSQFNRSRLVLTYDEINILIDKSIESRIRLILKMKEIGLKISIIESPKLMRKIEKLHYTDFETIINLDYLYRDRVLKKLQETEINYILCPQSTYDDEKFTLLNYERNDPTDPHHANDLWGSTMISLIIEGLKNEQSV
jgi:hypothetical protein